MHSKELHNELQRMQRNLQHSQSDYIQAARKLTYLTKAVDLSLTSLYTGPALTRAIWRYESLWLPLLAAVSLPPSKPRPSFSIHPFSTKVTELSGKNFAPGGLWLSREQIVPPLDIAWVWYVHRLDPHHYRADLSRFVEEGDASGVAFMHDAASTDINTAFRFSDGEDAQSKRTRRLWDIAFPFEPYMPKYLLSRSFDEEHHARRQHITTFTNEMSRVSFRSILTYDLIRAAALQKAFLYQIVDDLHPSSAELYETTPYLTRAYQRYLQFIALHKDLSSDLPFLVPMMDINIMWHMHLACTTEYTRDCTILIGSIVPHDTLMVDRFRRDLLAEMDREDAATGEPLPNVAALEEEEVAELLEKRRRGVAIKQTKELWEACYGQKPRYDLEDTRYRGEPTGDRGGFYQMFEKINGTTRDLSWSQTLLLMLLSVVVFGAGLVLLAWAFVRTMLRHGKFLAGLPAGIGVMALGVYIFLAIPISRPLSSDSRYWLAKSYKQTHDPLPPYLISTGKKTS